MAHAQAEPKLKRAAVGGVTTFVVIEIVLLFVEIPGIFSGYGHAVALLFSLAVFIGILAG